MKRLFLCSSFAHVANLFTEFAGEDLNGKSVAFIPTASLTETIKFYVKSGRKALEKAGLEVHELEITKATIEEISNVLSNCDYIYVTGGNTFFLLQELKRKGADAIIFNLVMQGKPYIGESAGAIIASTDTEYMRAVNFDPVSKAPELTEFSSLGLIDRYVIPHYGEFPFKKKAQKVVELFANSLQLSTMNNRQALIVEGSMVEIKNG